MNTDEPELRLVQAEQRVLEIQTKLHRWARDDPHRRFEDLLNLVADPAFLLVAWDRVRGNKGARTAGVDGRTARSIQVWQGVEAFLDELRSQLKDRSFAPLPVRERMIPKADPPRVAGALTAASRSRGRRRRPLVGPGDLPAVERDVLAAGRLWQREPNCFSVVVPLLPDLIVRTRLLVEATAGEERRPAYRARALLGHLGQEVLARLGGPDLSWVAANQSVGAAEQVGDPALAGASAWRVCHAVLRVDDMDEVYTGRPTPRGLERALDEPTGELLSVYGGFHLVGAVASARAGGRPPNARSPVAPEAANLSLDYTKAAFKGVAASDRPRSRRVKKCDQRGGEQDNKHGDDHGPDEVHRRLLASRAIATTTRTSKTSRSIDCRAAGAACQRGR